MLNPIKRLLLFAGLAGALVACTTELSTPGEPLRFIPQTLAPAFVDEPYNQNIPVAGGLSPYSYTLGQGSLPPGLTLQGGSIRGVPTTAGSYRFTVEVSDANLSVRPREFTLEVREPPPPTLTLNVPTTQMRNPFRLRGEIENAREVMALRTELRWDASRFELNEASLRPLQNNVALFHRLEEGVLHVDMALLGGSLSGRQAVFELELVPLEPGTIQVETSTEFHRLTGQHAFSRGLEGVASGVPPAPADDDFGEFDDLDDPLDDPNDPDDPGSLGTPPDDSGNGSDGQ